MPDDPYREWTAQAKRFRPELERVLCREGVEAYPNYNSKSHRAGFGLFKEGAKRRTILALAEDQPGNSRVLLRLTVGAESKQRLIRAGTSFTSATATDADERDRVDCYLDYGQSIRQEVFAAIQSAIEFVTGTQPETNPADGELTRVACDTADPPPRVRTEVSRIVRDTAAARELKARCRHQCQLCGQVLMLGDQPYSEAHHLQPLGGEHNGVDEQWNMMVVCPNCHAKLDFGAVRLEADQLYGRDKHSPRQVSLDYHNEKVFRRPLVG